MAAVFEGIQRKRVTKPRRVVFAQQEKATRDVRGFVRRALIGTGVIAAIMLVASTIASVFFYNHYSAIVERRVNAGFWQTRAGMYAAPYQIRKDQQASPETIVELLRRAGYIEGDS